MHMLIKWPMLTTAMLMLTACGGDKIEKARTDDSVPYVQEQDHAPNPAVHITPQSETANHSDKPKPKPAPVRVKTQTPTSAQTPANRPARISARIPARAQAQRVSSHASTPFPVRRCINLGNALEAPREGEWGYTIRAQDIATIKRAGFDTIRLPVRWDTHTSRRAPYTIDPAFMRRVHQVVGQAKAQGLNIIVDVHHYETLMTITDMEMPRFLAIWEQIATAFANEPSSVMFEVLNEPTLSMSMDQLNALYVKVLPIIRKINPSRKVLMGGNSWNSIDTLSKVKWPKDNNLVATYHDYGPHEFTHQGAQWMDPPMPLGRHWGSQSDRAEMRDTFSQAAAFKARTSMPVFVGEFGVMAKVNDTERNAWIKMRRKAMEAQNISWCVWDFSGAFSLYDMRAERWKPGALDALFSR